MAKNQAIFRMNSERIAPGRAMDLTEEAVIKISKSLHELLADVFALYMKTKNFQWHVRGPHFRDYRLLFGQQTEEIFAMTDTLAERTRKIGGATLRSVGDIMRHQTLPDNDQEFVTHWDMLKDLRADNRELTLALRSTHETSQTHRDFATAGLIENWIDETEGRVWHLTEIASDY
jgi:starvation-inducible DNA-binding protein